jgi:enterochelin esterase-like enzyme
MPPMQKSSAGHVERLANFPSKFVDARNVEVWLPPGYDPAKRYAVLYMHDGQMLFDAHTTWNRQAWEVAPTVQRLIDAGALRDTIVVGVWNTGPTRFAEYFPQGFIEHVPEGAARQVLMARGYASRPPLADAYLRFLVTELKPAIDARYRTRPGREHTAVAGSSMGGLISLYALCEYPQVFGGAACLSTHWIGGFERNAEIPAAGRAYLRRRLPAPGEHRLYMDRGTAELDALYDEAQAQVDALMRERGFGPPHFVTRVFEGEGHNERAWARRLEIPLRHLLGA